jgi:hypothetical protein
VCLATVAVDLGWLAATWPAESYGSADALGAGAWLLGVAVPLIVVSALGAVAAAGLLTGWRWSDWLAIPWVLFNAFGSGLMALLALVAGSGYGNLAPALATLPLVGAVSVGGSAAVGWLLLRGSRSRLDRHLAHHGASGDIAKTLRHRPSKTG